MSDTLMLNLRHQVMKQDDKGRNVWEQIVTPTEVEAGKVAILVCDMWDDHTCKAAAIRVGRMVGRMNAVLNAARAKGAHIIHGPNDCMDFYTGTPARLRMLNAPHIQPPAPLAHDEPAKPITDNNSSDSCHADDKHFRAPWTRQHAALDIDQDRDGISISGTEIYNYMQQHAITHYVLMGVHTNMCIMHRTFGVKQMVRWGVPTCVCRDLTDAMYNPEQPPYVSHDEGTGLIVGWIEKFWCPSIASTDLES